MRRLVVHAFGFGGALGLCEALRSLLGLAHVGTSDGLLLLAYGWLGYGLACACVALPVAIVVMRRSGALNPAAVATGVAVATEAALLQVRALASYQDLGMAWLALGCAALGGVLGLVTAWCIARVRPSRIAVVWHGVAAVALSLGLVLTLSGASRSAMGSATASPSGPNVLLISIDTLRIDRLGCYGADPTRTPRLDTLAEQSVLFENAVSPVALTGPSHATMLTGLYPPNHGVTINGMPISPDVDTVAQMLARKGYATAGFVSGWPLTDACSRLASRFQTYDEDFARWRLLPDAVLSLPLARLAAVALDAATGARIEQNERPGSRTVAHALDWISRHEDRRFFAFVHLYEPHAPYAPPAAYARKFDPDYRGPMDAFRPYDMPPEALAALVQDPRQAEHVEALYDGEVAYADSLVGELLDGLAAAGVADDTLVIFTADHGESMTEHGTYFDHDEFLYDVYVHVPLLLRFPRDDHAGTRSRNQVRLVDLTPTILDVTGAQVPSGLDGSSLVPLVEGRETGKARIAFGSVARGTGEDARSRYYVRSRGYKLTWTFDRRRETSERPAFEELYDLSKDPGELHDLFLTGRPPAIVTELRRLLAERVQQRSSKHPVLDAEVRRRLHSLGYL